MQTFSEKASIALILVLVRERDQCSPSLVNWWPFDLEPLLVGFLDVPATAISISAHDHCWCRCPWIQQKWKRKENTSRTAVQTNLVLLILVQASEKSKKLYIFSLNVGWDHNRKSLYIWFQFFVVECFSITIKFCFSSILKYVIKWMIVLFYMIKWILSLTYV